ncbi:MAG: Rpn family recombination-promoting nuclease/putative transposase [Thermodesulfobacteriota bacterium]
MLFKELFARMEVARDFALKVLPSHVSTLLQTGSFRLRKDSFVDTNLKEHFSDLLYEVDFREEGRGFLYLLFEHKSYLSTDVAYQLLRYKMRIWEHASRASGGSLPPIFAVVLYHGTARWTVPLNFASLYQGPESVRLGLLDFNYHLVDLSAYSDEELKMWGMAALGALLLKHIFRDDLVERLTDILGLLRSMNERTALEFLELTLRYVGSAAERVTPANFRQALQEALAERGDPRMNNRLIDQLIADHLAEHQPDWWQEAMELGRQEGRQEGAASLTMDQLTRKFGGLNPGFEARVQRLPLEDIKRLWEDLPDLESESSLMEWLDRREKTH